MATKVVQNAKNNNEKAGWIWRGDRSTPEET